MIAFAILKSVMAGLIPAIRALHVLGVVKTWMPRTQASF
jgi:hypothetical protein